VKTQAQAQPPAGLIPPSPSGLLAVFVDGVELLKWALSPAEKVVFT
jgi:hypothetical protein